MIKKAFSVFMSVFICLLLIISSSASVLSPGMQIIRRDIKVIKTCSYGEKINFTRSDFSAVLGEDELKALTIRSLPDVQYGNLKFGNLDAFAGQIITCDGIEFLTFEPACARVSCSFDFSVNDGDVECLLYVIDTENSPPTCESFKMNTAEDVPVFGCLKGCDIDKDEVEFLIVSQPKNGLLTIKDKANGVFKYTPGSGFKGTDSFTYRVSDKYGNLSDIATVSVKTSKNKSGIVYSDMAENPAQYASIVLAENNILIGEKIGDNLYFYPSSTVERGDFLVMAMQCAKYSPNIYTQTFTGFDDDEKISARTKGYVVTALNLGIDCAHDEKNMFAEHEAISEYEAAKIVSSIIFPHEEKEVTYFLENTAIQAGNFKGSEMPLSRQNAALLLNMIYENKPTEF